MEEIDFPEEEIGWSDLEEGEWVSWPERIEIPLFDQDDWSEYDFGLERELDSDLLSMGFSDEDSIPADAPVEGEVESVNSEDWPWPLDDGSRNEAGAEEGEEKEADPHSREPVDIASLSIGEYTEEDMSRYDC